MLQNVLKVPTRRDEAKQLTECLYNRWVPIVRRIQAGSWRRNQTCLPGWSVASAFNLAGAIIMLDFCPPTYLPLKLTTSTEPLVITKVLKRVSCLERFFVASTTNLQRFSTLDRASLDVFTNQLCHRVSTCATFRRLCPCSLLRSCEHHPGS